MNKLLNVHMTKFFSITLALLNFLLVIFMAVVIAKSTDPVAVNAWLMFIPLDFPISLGLFPIGYIFDGDQIISSVNEAGEYNIFRDIDNFWLPALYFGILGTLQWYYIPRLICKLASWVRSGRNI